MGRILAIDVGQKRYGLAMTDPLRMIANPLETVHVKDIWDYIQKCFKENEVDMIVVGYPLNTDGSDSAAMKFVKPFVNRFKKLYPDVDVHLYDERFTSVMAQQAILMSGASKSKRQDKGLVDTVSATILLQSFLESSNYKSL